RTKIDPRCASHLRELLLERGAIFGREIAAPQLPHESLLEVKRAPDGGAGDVERYLDPRYASQPRELLLKRDAIFNREITAPQLLYESLFKLVRALDVGELQNPEPVPALQRLDLRGEIDRIVRRATSPPCRRGPASGLREPLKLGFEEADNAAARLRLSLEFFESSEIAGQARRHEITVAAGAAESADTLRRLGAQTLVLLREALQLPPLDLEPLPQELRARGVRMRAYRRDHIARCGTNRVDQPRPIGREIRNEATGSREQVYPCLDRARIATDPALHPHEHIDEHVHLPAGGVACDQRFADRLLNVVPRIPDTRQRPGKPRPLFLRCAAELLTDRGDGIRALADGDPVAPELRGLADHGTPNNLGGAIQVHMPGRREIEHRAHGMDRARVVARNRYQLGQPARERSGVEARRLLRGPGRRLDLVADLLECDASVLHVSREHVPDRRGLLGKANAVCEESTDAAGRQKRDGAGDETPDSAEGGTDAVRALLAFIADFLQAPGQFDELAVRQLTFAAKTFNVLEQATIERPGGLVGLAAELLLVNNPPGELLT